MSKSKNTKIISEAEVIKEFEKWRERVRKKLPELSQRVFALRGKTYMGSGFGWSLEKDLGYVIRSISNSDIYPDFMERILISVVTESLFKQLNRIEKEINNK